MVINNTEFQTAKPPRELTLTGKLTGSSRCTAVQDPVLLSLETKYFLIGFYLCTYDEENVAGNSA